MMFVGRRGGGTNRHSILQNKEEEKDKKRKKKTKAEKQKSKKRDSENYWNIN